MIQIKVFMGYIKLDQEVDNDLTLILNDFSFYNGLFKKFHSIFDKLKLEPISKNKFLLKSYLNTYWTLFVLTHKYVMDKKSDIVESVSLLGAIFYWGIKNGDIITKKISKNASEKSKIAMEISTIIFFSSYNLYID